MDSACVNKIKNAINMINLKTTDSVIDIGCGWGGAID